MTLTGERKEDLRVAVGGFGAIGGKVAAVLDQGIPGLKLVAITARNHERANRLMEGFRSPVPILPMEDLANHADIVVECAPATELRRLAEPALRLGRRLVVISVGALIGAPDLINLARVHAAQIIVPTGALIGLDAVTAAAEGTIRSVKMVTRKPPLGFTSAPYVIANHISLEGLVEPLRLFSGTARDGALGFPDNLNVAAALAFAGIGPDRTLLEVWADPALTRNEHRIEVEADSASFTMSISNIPSENPKTGRITALSVIAALRKMTGPVRIGT